MSLASKKRILYLHSSAERFGSDKCLYSILRDLDRNIYEPFVVLPESGPLVEQLKSLGIGVTFPPCMGIIQRFRNPVSMLTYFFKLAREIVWLVRFIKKHDISLIHVNTSSILGGLIAGRLCGVPGICHVREIRVSPRLIGIALATLVNIFAKHSIAISNAVVEFLKTGWIQPRSVGVIHDGIETETGSTNDAGAVKAEFNIPPDDTVIGTVGRITFWKGFHIFVDAAREVLSKNDRVHFLIVGSPDTEDSKSYYQGLVDLVEREGLSDRVHFAGFRKDIGQMMDAMDVFVLNSVFPEPFGLVTIEAMLARKAVVVTAHGGSLDIVRDQVDGFHCPPDDAPHLARLLTDLFNDSERYKAMGESGHARVIECFNIKTQNRKVYACYQKLLN